jgi:hypothetical protein
MSAIRQSAVAKGGKPWWLSLPLLPVAGWILSQNFSRPETKEKSHPLLSFLGSHLPKLAFSAVKKFAPPVSFLSRFFS